MAIQEQQRGQVESFLANLVSVHKCLQLYPANSPMILEAVAKLTTGLEALFKSTAEPIVLGVIRDQFVHGRTVLESANDSIRRFAAYLYRAQVKILTVYPGVTTAELKSFLALVSQKPEEILAAGGLAAQMTALKLSHISIDEAAELQIVDRRNNPDQWDILDFIRSRRGGGGSTAGAHGVSPDSVAAEELAEFFRSVAEGMPGLEQYFHNTLGDPARIAEVFNCLAGTRQLPDGDFQADSPQLLDQAFNHISDVLATLPESVQEAYAKNIAKALDEARHPVRKRFTEQILPAQLGQFGPADRVVSAMADEAVTNIMTDHVMYHEGTWRTLENFLDGFTDDAQRSAVIREAVAANLAEAPTQRFEEIATLLEDKTLLTPSADHSGGAAPGKSRDHTNSGADELLQQVRLERFQAEHMSRDVSEDCGANPSLYATDVALSLQRRAEFGVYAESTAQLVVQSLEESLELKRYDQMAHTLEQTRKHEELIPGLQKLSLDGFATDKRIDEMIDTLRLLDPVSVEYVSLVNALRLCGERVVTRLFDRMAIEPDRPARMFLLQIFLALGKMVAGFLGPRIGHPEWFVVRNIVYVLGKVAPESSVRALTRIVHHPEPRVRLELVQALGTVGGDEVENAMLKLVADSDPGVAELAAGFLRRFDGERVLPAFRSMLVADRKSLHERPYVASRILRVFAETGMRDDLRLIAQFRPSLLQYYSRPIREVGRDCKVAMRRIKERTEKGFFK